jgi:hypothetical protein
MILGKERGVGLLPRLLPVEAIPVANASFVVKYCDTITTLGRNNNPQPIPTVTP